MHRLLAVYYSPVTSAAGDPFRQRKGVDVAMNYPDHPPQHPLADAVHKIIESYITAHKHVRMRNGQYTDLDLTLIERLRESVWMHYFRCAELAETVRRGIAAQASPAIEMVENGRCAEQSLPMTKP